MLDASLLSDYCERFFGFGRWNAPVWLIGIEEAGGHDEAEIKLRLDTWAARSRLALEDALSFYPALGNNAWHGSEAELQPTWQQLIRMLLRTQGEADTGPALLDYQRRHLGSANGETCVVELLPLPSPRTGIWNYSHWCALPWLQNRTEYLRAMREKRARMLMEQLRVGRPKLVVFYGTTLPGPVSLLPTWARIAGADFYQAVPDRRILLESKSNRTSFFVTKHPAAEDIRPNADAYFREVGDILRIKCGKDASPDVP